MGQGCEQGGGCRPQGGKDTQDPTHTRAWSLVSPWARPGLSPRPATGGGSRDLVTASSAEEMNEAIVSSVRRRFQMEEMFSMAMTPGWNISMSQQTEILALASLWSCEYLWTSGGILGTKGPV